MSSPANNKRKGAYWETVTTDSLREAGFDAEQLHLQGAKDEGDVRIKAGGRHFLVEAKYAKLEPTPFLRQAAVEAGHYAAARGLDMDLVHPVVFVRRKGFPRFEDNLALLTIEEYLRLINLISQNGEC